MIQAPETFGKYALQRRIALGGMAEIFKATTRGPGGFERVVAIKRLHRHMSEDPDLAQMLVDEARLAVQLQHPNIGQVFDLGSLDGQYFIVMEFIDGVDLHQILRQCKEKNWRVPPPLASWMMIEALEALEFAHEATDAQGRPLNVVHRDVSPQNIMVTYNGDVKLVDFGIAKAEAQVMQTQAGIIKGKFYYMSPEQAFGKKLDRRSDVFAAGMVVYELLTGRPAYEDAVERELIHRVRAAEFPPPSHFQRDIDPGLERIVMTALARDRDQRYPSARHLQRELQEHARRHFGMVTRQDVGQFVSELFGKSRPSPRPAQVMRRDEFSPDEDSMIFTIGDLSPTDPERPSHFAEASFDPEPGADADDPTFMMDNPFVEDEKTTLFTKDDDWADADDATMAQANPFAIPDTFSPAAPRPAPAPAPAPREQGGFALPPSPHSPAAPPQPSRPAPSSPGASMIGFGPPQGNAVPAPERTEMLGLDQVLERAGLNDLDDRKKRFVLIGAVAALVFGVLFAILIASLLFSSPETEDELESVASSDVEATDPAEPEPAEELAALDEPEPEVEPAPTHTTLEFSTTPLNAQVLIDGTSVGTTPVAVPDVEIGSTIELAFVLDGHETWSQNITVGAENEPIDITLEVKKLGVLQVVTEPAGLAVDVNGTPAGPSPVTIKDVERSEKHFVVVHKPDGSIHQEIVSWAETDEVAKTVNIALGSSVDAALPVAEPEEKKPVKKKRKKTRRKKRRRSSSSSKAIDPWGSSSKKKKSSGELNPWGN